MVWIILLTLLSSAEAESPRSLVAVNRFECMIVRGSQRVPDLAPGLEEALQGDFRLIRIEGGDWDVSRTITIQERETPLLIRGETSGEPVRISGRSEPLLSIRNSMEIRLENLTLEGTVQLEQTEDIRIHSVHFRQGGVHLKGKRCNQPNECTGFNRNIRIENCIFENFEKAIFAERMESSFISNNRFIGTGGRPSCEKMEVAIELDGSSEDLDRPLEQGHSKGNQITGNSFEQEFSIGIRVKVSLANVFRDNHFVRSFRAMEFLQGARYNQVLASYIGYLSQQPGTSACPAPCGIYVGPGTFNNIFINNFFEQAFELQFLERNRNTTFVIDESGNQNVFRSDFLRLR